MILSGSAKFNISVVRWPGPVPFFEAYRELAETVRYGLEKLGYDAVLSNHRVRSDRINILFGFHILDPDKLPGLPKSTIFYNLEQIVKGTLKPAFYAIPPHFTVWDYSLRNCEAFRQIGVSNVVHVPVGYVPEMARIQPAPEQDIDVLFYGQVNERRGKILEGLKQAGLKVQILQKIYGAERDQYIARSRIVLNMHLYETRIFEIVRVSYLLANSKAIVSEYTPQTEIEADLLDALVLSEYDELISACIDLVRDTDQRQAYETRGFEIMSARDECQYLRSALRRP